jgi:ribonuclease-3
LPPARSWLWSRRLDSAEDLPSAPLAALQRRLNYHFRHPELLDRAVTHPSYLRDRAQGAENYQRLEFLGDAVLQLILTERLFALFPEDREGSLSTRRASLIRGAFLVQLARETGLDACLRLGQSEEASGGRAKAGALEDGFEALVGALYLDSDWTETRRVVLGIYGDVPARLAAVDTAENPKGRLQEKIHGAHGTNALRYDVVAIAGADHARVFEVEVFLHERPLGRGRGPSKKLAEEAAARTALATLEKESGEQS